MFAGTFVLSVTLLAAIRAPGVNAKVNDNDKIVFPGPIQEYDPETRYDTVEDDIPLECRNKTYCTIKPKNYPQEKFDELIKYTIPFSQPEAEASDLFDKQGDPDEVDNCETQVEFEPLFKVKAKNGVWRNVVQSTKKNFVQSVRLETCRERNAPCFTKFPKLPAYTTFCKQKFSTWTFVVESLEDGGKEEKISVDLPTCCSCHYKPT